MEPSQYNIGTNTCVFLFLLIVWKNVCEVQKNSKTDQSLLTLVISLSAMILFVPVALAILLLFAIYRQIISCILKMKYGSKFLGLVEGSDAVHATDDPSNNVTHILAILEYDHERNPDNVFETIKQIGSDYMVSYLQKLPKFQSVFLKYMGYSYMLREHVTADECFRKMKIMDCQTEELDHTEFMELLSDCYNYPLPRNETIFWDIFVGTQPIQWKANVERKGIKYYPALFRNHHCVADGVALLKLWGGVFADKGDIQMVYCKESNGNSFTSNDTSKISSNEDTATFWKNAEKIIQAFLIGLLAPATFYTNLVLKAKDRNVLQGPPLAGKEILAMKAEESNESFLKIKKIKRRIPGTSFPEVLLAAFSASLADYFQKKSSNPPEFITTLIPLVSGSHELYDLVPGTLDVKNIQFRNSCSFVLLDLPIVIKNRQRLSSITPLLNRLELLKEQTNILKNSVDYQINNVMMSVIIPLLPQPLVRLLLSQSHCTATASIMPGTCKSSLGGGVLPVADCSFWVPHLKNIGVSFSALTYDKRLQLGLGADKALIPDQSDAQDILDGICRYLDLMEKELEYIA